VLVPVLETERLILRGHGLADFDDIAAMWADPDVTRFIGGTPSTREESWARLLRYVGHWELMGFGFWSVRERATDRHIGDVGIGEFKREMTPVLTDPELGWSLAAWAHGKGFATEAVRAVLAWGTTHFAGRRMVCGIASENLASIRVAQKCGFTPIGPSTYRGQAGMVYGFEPRRD
jgi:RimJ/RimL family protein N-acetyltransferase